MTGKKKNQQPEIPARNRQKINAPKEDNPNLHTRSHILKIKKIYI
jgi:ribosomal protein S30